jgi:O-antigen ligase
MPIASKSAKRPVKEKNLFIYIFNFWTFILISRPQDFIPELAPFRPALAVGVIAVISYAYYHWLYKNRFLDNGQCRLYLCLLAAMIISIPFAYYRRNAFTFFFTQYISAVIFLFLFYKSINSAKYLTKLLAIISFGTGLYLLCALYKGQIISGRLFFGPMFDPNDLAFIAISFLPFNFLFLSANYTLWKRFAAIGNIAIYVLVILMSGSRAGFVALCVAFLMVFFARARIIKNYYKIIIIFMVFIGVIYGGIKLNLSRLETIVLIERDYNVWDETGRLEVWRKGLGLMLSHPLTGVGVRCFEEAIAQVRVRQGLPPIWQTAHNSLLLIGAEIGIGGMILFAWISYNALTLFGKGKNIKSSNTLGIIGGMARIGFIGHIIAGMFLSQAYSISWVFFIALSARIKDFVREERLAKKQIEGVLPNGFRRVKRLKT